MIRRSRMQHNAIADVPQIAESLYAKVIRELEARFGIEKGTPHERRKDDSTKPDAA